MYNCVIVEDELPVMRQLEKSIQDCGRPLNIVAKAFTLADAIRAVEEHKPGIVFLDIKLGAESGFGLLKYFSEPFFETIIVTGYDQFAIEAFQYSAANYLLKPVDPEQLGTALDRLFKKMEAGDTQRKAVVKNLLEYWQWQMANDYRQILLPVTGEHLVYTLSEILMLEAQLSYTLFTFQAGGNLLIARGLFHYTRELEPFGFIRCHNSYLVNRRYIRKIVNTDSTCELHFINGLTVPVSRRYYKTLKETLQESIRFWPRVQFQDEKK